MLNEKLHNVMSILLILLFMFITGCSNKSVEVSTTVKMQQSSADGAKQQILSKMTDMAGREVELPKKINKVYGVNNNSTYLLYTIVPDKLIGWNSELTEDTKKYMNEKYANYPVIGIMYGGGKQVDAEEVLKYSPDVVILTETTLTDKTKETADAIQQKLGLPVVVVEANITNYDKAYTFLGGVLGEEERAKKLADYYKKTYDYAKEKSALVKDKIKVYYGREDDGLSTDFKGSSHTEVLDLVGGGNVAVVSGANAGSKTVGSGKEAGAGKGDGSGKANAEASAQSGTVSIEQILLWNPEVIIVGYTGNLETDALNTIKTDSMWAKTDAVKNAKVYEAPHEPFNWFDRPPSINRIIGIKWMGHLLYPEIYDCDMKQEVKEFFKLYYSYDLTDVEAERLLNTSK